MMLFIRSSVSEDIEQSVTQCPPDRCAALSLDQVQLNQTVWYLKSVVLLLVFAFTHPLTLHSQTSNLSEAAKPPWARRR